MMSNKDEFAPFMDEDDENWGDYISEIRKNGTWGGHLEL